jgi:hypothetical protein
MGAFFWAAAGMRSSMMAIYMALQLPKYGHAKLLCSISLCQTVVLYFLCRRTHMSCATPAHDSNVLGDGHVAVCFINSTLAGLAPALSLVVVI